MPERITCILSALPRNALFQTVNELYNFLSLKEVKRALLETQNAAIFSSLQLFNLVNSRYIDLLGAADTVGGMIYMHQGSMHIANRLQTRVRTKVVDFGLSATRRKTRRYVLRAKKIKDLEVKASIILQTAYRNLKRVKCLKILKEKSAAAALIVKRSHTASNSIIQCWRRHKAWNRVLKTLHSKSLGQEIESMLHRWSSDKVWELDDSAWPLYNGVLERDIEGVILRLPRCASALLFVALHIINNALSSQICLEHYFYRILKRTKGTLARYQLFFDMKFANMPEQVINRVIELLDPIDHSLMGDLVICTVKEEQLKARFLLKGNIPILCRKKLRLNGAISEITNSDNSSLGILRRSRQCNRFSVVTLQLVPRRKTLIKPTSRKYAKSEHPLSPVDHSVVWWW
jgi:hypothetical protein